MSHRKLKPGMIIEIPTAGGLAYAQYTRRHRLMGDLIRVLPGLHSERPEDLAGLAGKRESYWIFLPVAASIETNQAAAVGTAPIPGWATGFPLMKSGARDREGKIHHWWLSDGERDWSVDKLEPGQEDLSFSEIWTIPILAQRITEGWTPAREVARTLPSTNGATGADGPQAGPHSGRAAEDVVDSRDDAVIRGLREAGADLEQPRQVNHYLYFSKRADAERASRDLEKQGFRVEIAKGGDGVSQRVKASEIAIVSPDRLSSLRERLSRLAQSFRGEYDGWEAAVEPKANPVP